jgi:monoamine oxidase
MGLTFFSLERGKKATIPKVGIVGGGFAGLAAAYYLAQYGVKPVIFEARDRVGGRVLTRRDVAGGRLIEAGAELIGLNHPIWLDLALQFGLGMSVITDESHFTGQGLEVPVYVDGRRYVGTAAEATYREMSRVMLRLSDLAREVNPLQPWKAPQAARWDQMSLGDWLRDETMSDECREALRVEFENNNGASVDRQSLLFNLSQISGGGGRKYWDNAEVFRCGSGNDTLAKKLKEGITQKGGTVHLGSPVTKIEVGDDGVRITWGRKAKTSTFAFAILAIPPSVWNRGLEIGPKFKAKEYQVTMGQAVKYLSPLRRRFWLDSRLAPSSSSTRYGMTWEGTDNQIEGDGGIVELSLFAGGRAARRALEARNAHAFYRPLLEKVYGKGYSRNLIKRKAVFVPWPREEWTGAGYSCLKPGEVTAQAQNMGRPFEGRLYFAGEHSCPAFYGYMEGALHSGYRSGKDILLKSGWRKKKVVRKGVGKAVGKAVAGRSLTLGATGIPRRTIAPVASPTKLLRSLMTRWKL